MSKNTQTTKALTKGKLVAVATGAASAFAVAQANAAALDVSGVTDAISENVASLNTVAVSVIGVLVIIMVVNMIRRLVR